MIRRLDSPPELPGGAPIPLADSKKLLKAYYAGQRLPSPQGGTLERLRVRTEDDGSATILWECNASSLRYQLTVPKATRTERKKVSDMQADGSELTCPRHGPSERLVRTGVGLVCPLCGVSYGKVTKPRG